MNMKMGIQAEMNKVSIDQLPKIRSAMDVAIRDEYDQMAWFTLQKMGLSFTPIDKMNPVQLLQFQGEILDSFKFKGWMK